MNVEHGGVSWRQIRCTEESSMTAWIFLLPFFVLTYLYVVVVVPTYDAKIIMLFAFILALII